MSTHDSFATRTELEVEGGHVSIHSLEMLEQRGFSQVAQLPYSLKILLENLLRREDGKAVTADDVDALATWDGTGGRQKEIAFMPARVLLQDFTGVPAVVDLAAMRDGIVALGGDPRRVNPVQPVELVIDHSVQVDHYGVENAFQL
ncbi:MAG TPA: aconitase family protein, partial [Dehalococcoidia bacterium]|nr:aconitase family protein [Dehalococcoidia bacterium]